MVYQPTPYFWWFVDFSRTSVRLLLNPSWFLIYKWSLYRVWECQILFLAGKTKGCFYSPPYLDDYGETDQGLVKPILNYIGWLWASRTFSLRWSDEPCGPEACLLPAQGSSTRGCCLWTLSRKLPCCLACHSIASPQKVMRTITIRKGEKMGQTFSMSHTQRTVRWVLRHQKRCRERTVTSVQSCVWDPVFFRWQKANLSWEEKHLPYYIRIWDKALQEPK